MVTIESTGERTGARTGERLDEHSSDTGVLLLDLGRKTRRDALPEHTQYADTGCDVHPSCLTCPLVRCRYDEPGGARKLFNDDRDRAITGMQREGVTIDAIALRFGVSRRTVFRALAKGRTGQAPEPVQGIEALHPRGVRRGAAHACPEPSRRARGEVGGVPPQASFLSERSSATAMRSA